MLRRTGKNELLFGCSHHILASLLKAKWFVCSVSAFRVSGEVFSCSNTKVFPSSSTSHARGRGPMGSRSWSQSFSQLLSGQGLALKPGAGRPGRTRMKTLKNRKSLPALTGLMVWSGPQRCRDGTLMLDAIHHRPGQGPDHESRHQSGSERPRQREARHGQAMAASSLHPDSRVLRLAVAVCKVRLRLSIPFVAWADRDTLVFRLLRRLLEQPARESSYTIDQVWHSLTFSDSVEKSGAWTL